MALKRFTTYASEETIQRLKQLSEETRVPQAKYMEEALKDLLKKYEKQHVDICTHVMI